MHHYFFDPCWNGNVGRTGKTIVCQRDSCRLMHASSGNPDRGSDVRCFFGKTAFSEHSGSDSCDSSGFWNFPVSGRNDPWVSDICNGDPQCGYYRNCAWSIFLYDRSAAASRSDSSG